MSNLKHIDLVALRKNLELDDSALKELLEIYLKLLDEVLSPLVLSYKNADFQNFSRQAHRLAGASEGIFAIPVGKKLRQMEVIARQKQLPEAQFFEGVKIDLAEMRNEIKNFVKQT